MDSPGMRDERDANPYELPNVDDLEVAALAAASAMQAIKELQQGVSEEELPRPLRVRLLLNTLEVLRFSCS
jgi:hypothetical protein